MPPVLLALVIFTSNTWLSDSPSFILPAIYLGTYPVFLKYRHRLFGQKFAKVWATYAMFALLTTTLYWASKALVEKEYFSYLTLLISTSMIGLFYPFVTIVNSNLQRLIPLR